MAFEIQAHRGARALFPENTLQAFCHAAELGIRVLELDLVVSKDLRSSCLMIPGFPLLFVLIREGHPLSSEDRQRYILYDMMYADIASF